MTTVPTSNRPSSAISIAAVHCSGWGSAWVAVPTCPLATSIRGARMRAAIDRCTSSDVVLGADERVAPERALQLFLTSLGDPGGIPRRVQPGTTADLCLLDSPLAKALESSAIT